MMLLVSGPLGGTDIGWLANKIGPELIAIGVAFAAAALYLLIVFTVEAIDWLKRRARRL